jgi:DNA-binding transcriptional regulator YdaS (Cro superfamily)
MQVWLASTQVAGYKQIMSALQKAIDRAGNPTKLGKLIGISRQAVEQWKVVPPERVLAVEKATGVSRYELRPDIYGDPPRGRQSVSVAA